MTTITREQFEAALRAYRDGADVGGVIRAAGITIADPEPPEEMVKLAREIATKVDQECFESGVVAAPSDYTQAALQHVEKVVRGDEREAHPRVVEQFRANLLTAIGAKQ
jgi:hypothetical protein